MIKTNNKIIKTNNSDFYGVKICEFELDEDHYLYKRYNLKAGICQFVTDTIIGPRSVPWHLVSHVFEGELTCEWSGGKVIAKAGETVISPAGIARTITNVEGTRIFHFHLRSPDSWELDHTDKVFKYEYKTGSSLTHLLNLVALEYKYNWKSESMLTLLKIMPEYIAREFVKKQTSEDSNRNKLNRLWDMVSEQPDFDWTMDNMAEELCVSKGHLHYLTKKYHSCSPKERVSQIRMNYASHLLVTTDYKLSQIAELSGYGSAAAFSKVFTKVKGMRPGKFRNNLEVEEV